MNIALGFAALAWVLSAVAARMAPPGARPTQLSIRRDPMLIASILLVLSALPSLFISEDFDRAVHDLRSYWQLLIYFAVASHLLATGMRETAFRVLAISSILSCLVAFAQRSGGLDVGIIHIAGQHRVGSTLYTMTFAGILAQLVVFYAAGALARGLGKWERVLITVAVTFQFVALLLTMTRGAWLAVVVGAIALCLLIRNRTVVIAGAALLVLLLVFTSFQSRDQARMISVTDFIGSAPDRNIRTRLVLWEIAWDLFRENPVIGVGMGDYEAEAIRLAQGRDIQTAIDAHNVPLQILATRGLVGFIPFVYFWVMAFRVVAQASRRSERRSRAHHYALGGLAVIVVVLVGALTENNIDDEEVFITFMFLLGLARCEAYRPVPPSASEEHARAA